MPSFGVERPSRAVDPALRIEIAWRLREASGGRADGLGEALQLVDTFLRSEAEGKPVKARPIEEITRVVDSIAHA